MNNDLGVIYVLMEHFTRHLHPRAVEIEKELDAGRSPSEEDLEHVAQVLEEAKLLGPLIARHPEHRELAEAVIARYAHIATRARQVETPAVPGANAKSGGLA